MCIQVPCYVFHVSCPTCALGHGTDPEAGAPLMSIEKASGIWHREQVQWDPVKPLLERYTHTHTHTHTHTLKKWGQRSSLWSAGVMTPPPSQESSRGVVLRHPRLGHQRPLCSLDIPLWALSTGRVPTTLDCRVKNHQAASTMWCPSQTL
jgi:hypothetical protein